MSSRPPLPDTESLDLSTETAPLGVALVGLENLSYQPPANRPPIPLQPRKAEYWLGEFKRQGCFPNVSGNRIKAIISLPVLAAALGRSELTISDLQDSRNIKRLHFPEGTLLTYYHGQHRLEAAKQHIYPHNKWWAVELYDEERWDIKCRVKEQGRNIESIPHDDGTVFRFLDTEPDWRAAWRSKDAENDLKAIEKRPALYKGFTSLRPFVGLWISFQKGTLHRYKSLRCDDELIRYLHRIKHVWTSIFDGAEELMYDLDPETVEIFEGRAPKTSSADHDFITQAIENKSAFHLCDDVKRRQLLQNVLAIDGMIPSIKTLAKDSLYLEDCAKAMRTLIDPTERHMRDEMQYMWHGFGGDHIVLERVDGPAEYSDTQTDDEERFQIAYIQLWIFAMRNFHRLTSLVPKSDNKQKVISIGPDPQCLLEFARLAKALGFRSRAITSILDADADREHAKHMLSIARPLGRYDYDLESEITRHCQLLTHIRDRQQELVKPPVWTTTLSDVKVKQRYGRPHNQALKDCASYFFLRNICEIPQEGKYVTDLFVKRGIACSFFRIPPLPPETACHDNRMEGVAADGGTLQRRSGYDQTHQVASQAQTKSGRDATQDAALALRLEECERQAAEQERETSHYKAKLSEAQANSERLLAEVQSYRDKIKELDIINLQSRRNSQAHLQTLEKLQKKIKDLERTIADHQSARGMQVVQAKQLQDQQDMSVKLSNCYLTIADFERRISEYKSESDRQALAAESFRQQAATEAGVLQSKIAEWESGKLRRSEDINAEMMSRGFQDRVAELELVNQHQAKDLRDSKEAVFTKTKTLDMILAKIRETREGVDSMNETFTGRLQIEPSYKDPDCETIDWDEILAVDANFDEIEDLKKSIAKFIALYSQNNLAHDENSRAKVLEWQKLLPNKQLALTSATGTEVETEAPDLKQMLVVVSKRAEALEQEGRVVQDLQAELGMARAAVKSLRQKAERIEREARNQLEQERSTIRDLEESRRTACDATQREIELTSVLRRELDTTKEENKALVQKNEELLQQGRVALAELTGELATIKADAAASRKEAERVLGLEAELNGLKTALKAKESAQEQQAIAVAESKKMLSSYKDQKSAKIKAEEQLKASISKVKSLTKDLRAAQQSIKEKEQEIAGLNLEVSHDDDRVRSLKAQLSEVNQLIQLEKEKEKLEAEKKEIQAAKASSSPDLAILGQREDDADTRLSELEEKMVETELAVMRYAKYKVRFENSKTGHQTGVDHVLVEDLEKKFEELRNQVVYCFVNNTMAVVELGKYKDFLANQKHLADHKEFFYCSHNPNTPRKRLHGPDEAGEDLEPVTRLRAKSRANFNRLQSENPRMTDM